MGIRISIDQHGSDEATVDLNEDGNLVELILDFQGREFISPWRPGTKDKGQEEIDFLRTELARATDIIESARADERLIRHLLPDEARALAAMLRHYADEASQWRPRA